ncbi:MAG: hypothetical protein AN484_01225 [Aphanizomenon flos-aquae WA102]|uniref:Uncharacterized protein n=1 Tax=Aphanizomenon flos-aquae WA102 TaxID=1710896 RepID=A0A1B7X8E5_APHFL|nr:MAG: hypothetical protein AN484_01225 [Aphanizomenon flos-aquae WA102]
MITSDGQKILAKYLVGQAPAYASYIAIGCGAKPVASDHVFSTEENNSIKNKTNLDFEMFRVPITSRGYVNENNINKIVFTAELPTSERYEITEVGLWSAGSNPTAGSNDSRTIFSFSDAENWQYHGEGQPASIPSYEEELHSGNNVISKTEIAFQTNADNPIFTTEKREARGERCRFLNNMVAIRGDMSTINVLSSGKLEINPVSKHIHLTGASLDFDKASPKDDLRLAFSLINKDGQSDLQPDEIRVMIEFAQGDEHNVGQYARFETVIKNSDADVDFATGRYFVSVKKFEELTKSTGFTWNVVDVVRFYVSVIKNSVVSNDYYVCLDALRLENTTSSNPLYGLTGYSVIKNTNSKPILKAPNSTNHIEFRFGLDVL